MTRSWCQISYNSVYFFKTLVGGRRQRLPCGSILQFYFHTKREQADKTPLDGSRMGALPLARTQLASFGDGDRVDLLRCKGGRGNVIITPPLHSTLLYTTNFIKAI